MERSNYLLIEEYRERMEHSAEFERLIRTATEGAPKSQRRGVLSLMTRLLSVFRRPRKMLEETVPNASTVPINPTERSLWKRADHEQMMGSN